MASCGRVVKRKRKKAPLREGVTKDNNVDYTIQGQAQLSLQDLEELHLTDERLPGRLTDSTLARIVNDRRKPAATLMIPY